jgi:uncharacterized membrane protein YjjB (DUF3815 family)
MMSITDESQARTARAQTPDPDGTRSVTEESDTALVSRAAALLHTNGESTAVTMAAVDRLGRGMGKKFELIASWESTTLLPAQDGPRISAARPSGVGMGAVAIATTAIDSFGERGASDRGADRVALSRELDRASRTGPAPLWLFVLACATGPAALSLIFGAHDVTAVALVAASGAAGGLLRRALGRVHVGSIGQVFAAALLAGSIGGIAVNADLSSSLRLIAVCPAMILVPGPHILNGALDIFALRISLGFARLGYALVLVLAIGTGLALALAALGTGLPVAPAGRSVTLWVDVLAAAVAAASFSVYFAMPARLVVFPAVVGAIAHGLRTWAMADLGVDVAVGALLGCLLVGLVMSPLSSRHRVPFAAVAFASVVSLVPGVYLFRAIDALGAVPFGTTPTEIVGALADGVTATLIVMGMAVGLALPRYVFAQWSAHREATP